MHAAARAARAVCALLTASLLTSLVALPPPAAAAEAQGSRTALVVDVVDTGTPRTAHVVYDGTQLVPVASPGPVPGSLRLARPAGTTSGPALDVLPPDGAPFAVGTYEQVIGSWSAGQARPDAVLRLTGADGCSTPSPFRRGRLVVHAVEHDDAGALTSLSASFRLPCQSSTAEATGEIRYRSDTALPAVTSFSTSVGTVVSGSRTPFTARITNRGTTPVTLGAPTPVDRGPSAPRLQVTAGGDGCTSGPLGAGATCALALEHVDDGVAGGGYVAELRLAAPSLPRGHVAVLATAWEVVRPPGAPQSVRTWSAYDGVALTWIHDSSGASEDGWRVRRVDGPTPRLVATLPRSTTTWQDTSLAKAESATYEVAAYNLAGETAAAPVTVARQDRAEPPPAQDRRLLVVDEVAGAAVADTATGAAVQVTDDGLWRTTVRGAGATLVLPMLPGPGTYPVGRQPGELSPTVSGPSTSCSSPTGTAEVHEAWVRADGGVHRLDADLHLLCGSARVEVTVRLGTDGPYTAVTSTPAEVSYPHTDVLAAPAVREVSVANAGTGPVELGPASVAGADPRSFAVTGSTCGPRLDPGRTCAISVAFTPQRAGVQEAVLSWPVSTRLERREVRLRGSSTGQPEVRSPVTTAVLGRVRVGWWGGGDGGSPFTGFEVQRAPVAGAFTTVAELGPQVFTWTDTALAPGASYRYRVLAKNRFGFHVPGDASVDTVTVPREELLLAHADSPPDLPLLSSVPLTGGQPVPLAAEEADLPAVSPDGRQVAYVAHDDTGDAALWLRPLDGSAAPRLLADVADVDESDPAWSPDGTRICYSRLTATAAAVWCVAVTPGAAPAAFPGAGDAMEPSWLPDGSGLVVTDVSGSGLQLARIGLTGVRTVLPGTTDGSWPAVSPRGDRIAFVLTDDDGVDRLRVVGPNGGAAVDLATTAWEVYDRPSWAPDGSALVVPTSGEGSQKLTLWRAGQGSGTVEDVWISSSTSPGLSAVAWRRQDVAAPSISFPGGPVVTTGAVRLPVRVVDDTVPVGGLTVTCAVDGRPVGRCASGWSGTLPSGPHRLVVTASDLHGRTSTATHTWTVDAAAPTVAVGALPGWTLNGPATFSYAGSDAGGVASYDVRYRRAAWSGPFSAVTVPAGWAGTTARSRTLTLARGYEYCFSVRARDRAGNLSAWSGERCTAVPLDDRALARTTGGWTSSTAPTAFAGTLTRTSTAGARLVRPSAQVRRLALVATTCPTCGSVEVLVGSTRVGVVSLASSTTRPRQVLSLPLLGSVRTGTVTLRSLRTGRPVLVDALGLRRT